MRSLFCWRYPSFLFFVSCLSACGGGGGSGTATSTGAQESTSTASIEAPEATSDQVARVSFVYEEGAINFEHVSNASGGNGLSGAAWFDFDNDGHLDLFIPNGMGGENGLFRNQSDGTFLSVAREAGVEGIEGSAGVITADFNNDGHVDIFVTGDQGRGAGFQQAGAALFQNLGNGTFEDVTTVSGLSWPEAHRAASAADIDNDGLLDLVILGNTSNTIQKNQVFKNLGNMQFQDVSEGSGLDTLQSTCASLFSDYDGDGDQDLFLASCTTALPISLYQNNGDFTFTDVGGMAGLSTAGLFMGLCAADYDNDGDQDIFATNFGTARGTTNRPHVLYRNLGDGTFDDQADFAGIAQQQFGWGCVFQDLDNDGWDDLFVVGALDTVCQSGAGSCPDFEVIGPGQGNEGQLFFNQGNGVFLEREDLFPLDLSSDHTSAAIGADYNEDGFTDLLVVRSLVPAHNGRSETSGEPILLTNSGNSNHYIAIDLVGSTSNASAIGAKVTVKSGSLVLTKEVRAGSSHLSSESTRLLFGLADMESVDSVEVQWPGGELEIFNNVEVDNLNALTQGSVASTAVRVLTELPIGTGGLSIDRDGNLYAADFGVSIQGGGDRVLKINSVTGSYEVFATGFSTAAGNDFDSQGWLYQSSFSDNKLYKISPEGSVELFADGEDGLSGPLGVVLDQNDNAFVINCRNNQIVQISPDGQSSIYASSALFKCGNGITIDPATGVLYVSNYNNGDILSVDTAGDVTLLTSLPSNSAHLSFYNGAIYVSSYGGNQIYRVSVSGEFSVVVGDGQSANSGGGLLEASIKQPNDLAISSEGVMYIFSVSDSVQGVLSPSVIQVVEDEF